MPTAYATAADVEEDLGADLYRALADRDGDGSADDSAVDAALAAAGSVIDGYIARKLPASGTLPTIPAWLKQAAIDLAVYDLAETPSEAQKNKHDAAIRKLEAVAAGRMSLGVPLATNQLDDDVEFESADHVMTREGLAGIL